MTARIVRRLPTTVCGQGSCYVVIL